MLILSRKNNSRCAALLTVGLIACGADQPAPSMSKLSAQATSTAATPEGTVHLQSLPPSEIKEQKIRAILAKTDTMDFLDAHRLLQTALKDFPADAELLEIQVRLARVLAHLANAPVQRQKPATRRISYGELPAPARVEFILLERQFRAATTNSVAPDLEPLFKAVKRFNFENPNFFRGWMIQAQLALALDREIEGQIAARNLSELGAAESGSSEVAKVMAALSTKNWLSEPKIKH